MHILTFNPFFQFVSSKEKCFVNGNSLNTLMTLFAIYSIDLLVILLRERSKSLILGFFKNLTVTSSNIFFK